MGQCFGWSHGGAPATRTNRRFEYTPKKSWKYKDSHIMTQFQALSMDSEEEGGRGAGLGEGGQFSVGGLTSGSEDELYEVDLRNTKNQGKLVFTDEEEEEIGNLPPGNRSTIINKGFMPLEDQSLDSPRMARLDSNDDKLQLLQSDTLDRDAVT